jgi:hypothetical protein
MKARKEIREEREDVVSFYCETEVQGINGSVMVEEKVDETTELALNELKAKLESDLALVNEKIDLCNQINLNTLQ